VNVACIALMPDAQELIKVLEIKINGELEETNHIQSIEIKNDSTLLEPLISIEPLPQTPIIISVSVPTSNIERIHQSPYDKNANPATTVEGNDINNMDLKTSLLERLLNSNDIQKMIEFLKLVSNQENKINLDRGDVNTNLNPTLSDQSLFPDSSVDFNPPVRNGSLSTMGSPRDGKSISGSTNSFLDLLGQEKGVSKYTETLRKILKQMPTSKDSKVQLKSLQEVLKLGYNIAQKERHDKEKRSLKHGTGDDSDALDSNESINSDNDGDDNNKSPDYDKSDYKNERKKSNIVDDKEQKKNDYPVEEFYPDPFPESNYSRPSPMRKENNLNTSIGKDRKVDQIRDNIPYKKSYRDDYYEPNTFHMNESISPLKKDLTINSKEKSLQNDPFIPSNVSDNGTHLLNSGKKSYRDDYQDPITVAPHASSPRAPSIPYSPIPYSPRSSLNIPLTDLKPTRANSPSLTNRKNDRGYFSQDGFEQRARDDRSEFRNTTPQRNRSVSPLHGNMIGNIKMKGSTSKGWVPGTTPSGAANRKTPKKVFGHFL